MTTANPICEKAKIYYYDYLTRQKVDIPADIAEHLELCRFCKAQIKLLSEQLEQTDANANKNAEVNSAIVTNLRLHFAYVDKPVSCKTVLPFLPGLADETLKVGIPTPITVHLDNCKKCEAEFERIKNLGLGQKELFRLAQDFAKKPKADEPGVVTCYKIKGQASAESLLAGTAGPYDEWPIEVEVLQKSQEAVVAASVAQTRFRVDLRPILKPILAVAAVVLLALFVMHSNIAKAIDLEQIYKAITQAKNVCMTSFASESDTPIQKIWVSRDLNVKIGKAGTSWVLWDIDEKVKKSKDSIDDRIETKFLDGNEVSKVSESMSKSLDILPFVSMPEALNKDADAKWQEVNEKEADIKIVNTEIYDLIWIERTIAGKIICQKFRCYIDTKTYLPKRIERFHKYSEEDGYELTTVMEVTYPGHGEISSVIQNAGF